ncbi:MULTISPECIES: hypothetical protein [Heyndrickxia]|uniref:hypothetical protein n=1 Tax=Heyndrickxia TaxID=2837504 RepID=UPI001B186C44|nr:hypothetical protein [Heyndrickxia oleronia]GIN38926.1 hypothetical protein J19TS1_18750 [Heyndrickxia oleronia]
MKLFGISIGLISFLIALSIGIDMIMGFELKNAIFNAFNPFRVMDTSEFVVFFFFILVFLIQSMATYVLKKKKKNPS